MLKLNLIESPFDDRIQSRGSISPAENAFSDASCNWDFLALTASKERFTSLAISLSGLVPINFNSSTVHSYGFPRGR